MKNHAILLIFTMVAIPVILIGCSARATPSPTTNPGLILTAANQTAEARVTQIIASTPSATPVTPSPTIDTVQTMAAQTASALLTQAASLTPSVSLTPVPTGPSGDRAVFVADVTIPDGKVISPGTKFTKTWRLQNSGNTTWTTSYTLAFTSGEQMGAVEAVHVSQSVPPGQQIDVSVDMVAPANPGTYQGNWKMKNAAGLFFNDPVYVLITVGNPGGTPSPTTGTPGATLTPTGTPVNPITSLTMSVDNPSANECPHTFIFTAWVTVNQSATLTYQLDAGSDTGYQFDLPAPQTTMFEPGTSPITFEMTFTSAGSGWLQLHVTAPVETLSNQASFTITCGR